MDAFDSCVRNGRLKPVPTTNGTAVKELLTAREELVTARSSFGNGHFSDAITHVYFSMSRSARSLLLAAGYRDTNLYSLIAGINRLYVSPGAIDPDLIELLKIAKDQKDLILRGARSSRGDAGVLLAAAERLAARAIELVGVSDH